MPYVGLLALFEFSTYVMPATTCSAAGVCLYATPETKV